MAVEKPLKVHHVTGGLDLLSTSFFCFFYVQISFDSQAVCYGYGIASQGSSCYWRPRCQVRKQLFVHDLLNSAQAKLNTEMSHTRLIGDSLLLQGCATYIEAIVNADRNQHGHGAWTTAVDHDPTVWR